MVDRTIAGTVNADGTIKSGQEFSVSLTTTGHYMVAFRPAFAQIAGGSVTQIYSGDGSTLDNCVLIKLNATEAFIKTGDMAGRESNRAFTFIFVGTGSVAVKT